MDRVGVFVKVAAIIDLLSRTHEAVAVSEIARGLGIPRATLHRRSLHLKICKRRESCCCSRSPTPAIIQSVS